MIADHTITKQKLATCIDIKYAHTPVYPKHTYTFLYLKFLQHQTLYGARCKHQATAHKHSGIYSSLLKPSYHPSLFYGQLAQLLLQLTTHKPRGIFIEACKNHYTPDCDVSFEITHISRNSDATWCEHLRFMFLQLYSLFFQCEQEVICAN